MSFPYIDLDDVSHASSVSRESKTRWVEESFTFDRSVGRQTALPGSRTYLGSSLTHRHIYLLFFLFGAFFIIIIGRLIHLQLFRGDEFRLIAEGNRERIVPIPSERGLIFDRYGRKLTENIPRFSLELIPQNLPRDMEARKDLVKQLSLLTKRPEEDIWNILEEYGAYSYESIVIQENLDYETALRIDIASTQLPGISVARGSKRLYIHTGFPWESAESSTTTRSLSHILGYEGKLSREELDILYAEGYLPNDALGKSGIEKTYETHLRGQYGKKRIEVNALGREQQVLTEIPPTPGYHLSLSIDAAMQQELEAILRRVLAKNNKTKAAGIVLRPENGEILALVSLPSFDGNDFSGGISRETYARYLQEPGEPLFNRAIGGTYPPGSTVKPAVAAAALEEHIIDLSTVFLSTGGLQVGQWFFPDWRAGGHGWVGVIQSLAQSVNTFYYYIGGGYSQFEGLGVSRIVSYLQSFGFDQMLGVDIPGEAAGFLPSEEWKERTKDEPWYIGDTYNLSIGQGDLLATPLQIAAMTSMIANGGTLYRPHLVSALVEPTVNTKTPVTATVIRHSPVDPVHLETVRRGMRECVKTGSCRRLAGLPLAIAGKTGTAEWRDGRDPHAWFTSFAPYDKPEIVLTIIVEEGGEGSAMSVPIAESFYSWWWRYRTAHPVDNVR